MDQDYQINQEYNMGHQALEQKKALPFKKAVGLGIATLVAVAVAWGGWVALQNNSSDSGGSAIANANAANGSPTKDTVVANINGVEITQFEIAGFLQSGVDKAIVIDRYINKVVAAERGKKLYANEATVALRAAEREVLSTLYSTKRMEELRAGVSDAQVKAYYDKNVLDENFKLWKVSYYLSNDANDVQRTLQEMKKGEKTALEQLKPLIEQGDGFAIAAAMPYNLGRVVSKMKKGDFSEPLSLRNGILVLKVDDARQLDKPKLEDVKQEIVQALALQKFNEELEQARKTAKVELS